MENQIKAGEQNTQQVGQSPVNQPVVTPEKLKINYLMVGGIALVCSLIFGFGGYYLGKQSVNYNQNSSNPTTQPISSSNPTATPTIFDSTANWETYTSLEYSFKHPKNLKSDTGAAGTGFESIRFQFIGPKQIASGRTQTSLFDGYSFVVTKIGSTTQKTPEQWATERRSNSKENCGPEVILSDVKQITVDKANGVQYSVKNCIGDYTSSYVSNGGSVYEVSQLYVGEQADQKGYEEITNEIFNSLKFL